MNQHFGRLAIGTVILMTILGIGAYAFAGWGNGYGCGGRGPGWRQQGFSGTSFRTDLNETQIQQIEKERQSFFEATDGLRQELYAKEMDLRAELANQNPNAKKAAALQKEISELESKLDQKRINHMIKMREIQPEFGGGYMGKGRGFQRRGNQGGSAYMGYGRGAGSGACWR